jgi:hypothetical protein
MKQPGAVQRALRDANITAAQVDGIAFTRGPGKNLIILENIVGPGPTIHRYDWMPGCRF